MKHHAHKALTLIECLVVLAIVVIVALLLFTGPIIGTYPFGPRDSFTAKVQRLYVDVSGSKESTASHYMVGTDKGVFEVDNSIWLSLYNADELYSRLEVGKTYRLTTKGRKLVNAFCQTYPGIVAVEALPSPAVVTVP